jgi:drug/metabolite transporter (DMT)-like permease
MALMGGVFFTGVSAVLIKSAHAPGIVTAFYRMAIGSSILILPFMIFRIRSGTRLPIRGVLFAMLGGFFFACDMSLWATAIVTTNATLPTLTANLAPVWAGLGALWLFREKPQKGFWIGLALSLAGILVMIGKDLASPSGALLGAFMGMLAGMFYGSYYLATQKGRGLLGTLDYLSISTFTSAVVLLVLMIVFDYNFTGYDTFTWINFLTYGAGVQVVGWWLINYAQGYLKATVVAPSLLGQPVVTAIAAWIYLGERHSLSLWLGGCIVIVGIYMVVFTRQKSN